MFDNVQEENMHMKSWGALATWFYARKNTLWHLLCKHTEDTVYF